MADLNVRAEGRSFSSGSTDWSAVWAGLFTFVEFGRYLSFSGSQFFLPLMSVPRWDLLFGQLSSPQSQCLLLGDKQVHVLGSVAIVMVHGMA